MKKVFFVILTILVFFINGCSQALEPDNSEIYESHEQPIAEYEEVYTLGLYDGENFEYERSFEIQDNNFQKDVVISNKTSKEGSFILLVFNHGDQLNFEIENKEVNKYIFNIQPGEYKQLDVTLHDFKDGFHSITYVLLSNPEELPSDEIASYELSDIFAIRVNLFNNISTIPSERPEIYLSSKTSDTRNIHGILLSDRESNHKVLYKEIVNENTSLSYKVSYGNSNAVPLDFYLISLVNFEQVPIGKTPYAYDVLESDQEKEITINMESEILKNKHNSYQLLMIPTPFASITKESPFLLQEPLASNRAVLTKE